MSWLLIFAAAALFVVALAGLFVSMPPTALARGIRAFGIALGVVIIGFLAFRGQLGLALFALPALLPLLRRRWRSSRRPPEMEGGRSSTVETATLHMVLDHDSGAMAGEILRGDLAGRSLDSLDRDSALALLADCAANDPQSVPVLEAYLDRRFPDWREAADSDDQARGRAAGGGGSMTREEALEILGLQEGATSEDIRRAHRELMMRVHPDRGGSSLLAAKINQARETLLGG